jgi:phenylacetate-CoA ligase
VLKVRGLAPHYQIELSRAAHLDRLAVAVECLAEGASAADRAALQRQLEGSIKAYIGLSAEVRVGDPGSLERSQGKARRVIDRRDL